MTINQVSEFTDATGLVIDDRLEQLEMDNRVLRKRLDACEDQPDQQSDLETGGENDSIWNRAKRFV